MRALIRFAPALLILFSTPVFALSTLYRTLPDYFSTPTSTMVSDAIGAPCTAMTSIRFVLPCNPALISQSGPDTYSGQLFIGSGASQIQKLQHLLDRDQSPEFIQSMFENPRLQTEANLQMNLRAEHWGAALVPERLVYASVIHNEAYPVIAIEAMQERSAIVQGGGEIYKNIYAGLQLRLVDRQFVAGEFSLFDALTAGENSVLPLYNQDALYVEPGLAYLLKDDPWRPRATLKLSNVGFANQRFDVIPMRPVIDAGFGLAPPVGYGELEVAVNYRASDDDNQLTDSLRLGASYSLGFLQAIFGIGHKDTAIGVISSVGAVRTGITFSYDQITNGDGSTETAKTIFTEFGIVY